MRLLERIVNRASLSLDLRVMLISISDLHSIVGEEPHPNPMIIFSVDEYA